MSKGEESSAVQALAQGEQRSGTRMAGLGYYEPVTVVDNAWLGRRLGVSAEWITVRTGIERRRVAAEEESVVDMAAVAGEKALASAGIDAAEIDAVVAATSTAASTMPSVAAAVSGRLDLSAPAAFDVNNACSGFCSALAVSDAMVRSGTARSVLVVAVDKPSAWLDWDDLSTAILFADGAGAAVVTASQEPAIGPVAWGSFGDRGDLITIDPRHQVMRMEGRQVFRWASGLAPLAARAGELAGVVPGELAGFVPHQANLRIIDALASALGFDDAVVARTIQESGNTVAASIPLALAQLVERGELGEGDRVLLFGFGAGLAYAGQVVQL